VFHPAAFGAGVWVTTIVGAVLSTFTVVDAVPVLPARSVQVAVSSMAAPSPVEVDEVVQFSVSMPGSASVQFHVT
jgi:hypothetical protein